MTFQRMCSSLQSSPAFFANTECYAFVNLNFTTNEFVCFLVIFSDFRTKKSVKKIPLFTIHLSLSLKTKVLQEFQVE